MSKICKSERLKFGIGLSLDRIERTFKTQNPCPSDHSEAAAVAPFEMATLKSKAFKQTKKERQEEMKDIDMGLEQDTKSKRRSSLRGKK